ncbi:ATP-binding cassette domain-containing protein [Niabella yanshanensis]|uniref:ATP-binding cassette domain-containing protein n=1 Tax=Niabella yanshanensis TaxID=577386 RepID=A0ABZ0W657_9BACT|nr:ATP-binding cassette domain-containing protein [Niabella yanshanensis]WQD37605.1 ATP-binding cassette domain-containing protein [Niabella yanshanensis]
MIVDIKNLSARYEAKNVLHNISLSIQPGENYVIRGESGSGKTTLGKVIAGLVKYTGELNIHLSPASALKPAVHFVESWYRFTNLEGDRNFYYQQRYNHQQKRDTVTIARELELYGKEHSLDIAALNELITTFSYAKVLDEQLFEISSGEHKKLQLIKALWLSPQLLIIDQPYTGLDVKARAHLNQVLNNYVEKGGTLTLISNDTELPDSINRAIFMKDGTLINSNTPLNLHEKELKPLPSFLLQRPQYTSHNIISMKNIRVRYDQKEVLSGVDWEVNAGERWLLQGHNGSGKSTLLSLITGDHPQAYANDIKLFGVQRGGGESIWDIKRRIGMISPEMHWYFDANATVLQSLASGFFDSNGLYRQLRYTQKQQLEELLQFLDLQDVKNELLSTQPLGKQRLALLGRTIIKNPQLLVLDEPCQGLDQQQTQYFNKLVDEISKNGVTIIYVGHFETQLPSSITHKLVLKNGKKVPGI